MDLRDKKTIIVSFLMVILFFLGIFFAFQKNIYRFFYHLVNKSETIIEEENPIVYPKLSDEKEILTINAEAVFSLYYDLNQEKVLFEKNPDKKLPIASISKIMTALVVFENYDLEEKMEVTEYDVISRTEFRDFRAWSDTKIDEMLYPMIIESNNSAAFALALISNRFFEDAGDPVENFVYEMNRKAKEIGLKETNFINPSGLDGRDEYNESTARDVALFAKYLIKNENKIFEISKMPSYRLYSSDKTVYYDALSTNVFLHHQKKDWSEKIYGGKTGFTWAAFGCLLLILEAPKSDGYIINVVLGAEDRFLEMEKLVDYIYDSYIF
jgi:serine-type D-Ala-D-Ala carboxypeptidase (penicillin-binding protein 5/6)